MTASFRTRVRPLPCGAGDSLYLPDVALPAPVMRTHGLTGQIWPVEQTRLLLPRLNAAGKPPDVYHCDGGHMPGPAQHDGFIEGLVDFLKRNLAVV